MKFKLTGMDEITLRGVTFEKGKAVEVEGDEFANKLRGLDYFEEVKRGPKPKAKANDKDKS